MTFLQKLSYIAISILTILLVSTRAIATQPESHLVFDVTQAEEQVAKKFRIIPELRASGSGQFSADELPKILHSIPAERRQDIWIVDLRQESHGFIDGLPVSWITDRNLANAGKTPGQIEREEKKLLRDLSKQKAITVYSLKKLDHGRVRAEAPTKMIPESIETEQELVTSLGAQYARIYVLDHNKPDDAEVDNFVAFIKQKIKARDWVHFHCRGGAGRSSTFIALYDMIRNAHNASFSEIIFRQGQMGNIKLNGLKLTTEKMWKSQSSQERYIFLRKFYSYVQDPRGYKVCSWSAWQKLQESNSL